MTDSSNSTLDYRRGGGWRTRAAGLSVTLALAVAYLAASPSQAQAEAAPAADPAQPVATEVDYLADSYGLPAGHSLENVTIERLSFLLGYTATNSSSANTDPAYSSSGNYAFVFGGPENLSSTAAVGLINDVAEEYKVDKVYHFDPKLDGDKLDITSTDAAVPANFQALWSGTLGIKTRLKNIDPDYTSSDTYFFIYNKDRTVVDSSGATVSAPIVGGVLSEANSFGPTQAASYKQEIAQAFEAAGVDATTQTADVTTYPFFDYFKTRINGVIGTQSAFEKVRIPDTARENFSIQTVTYPELLHILDSEGDFAIFFGGTWCPYTSPTDNIANTAAKNAGIRKVYQFDLRLDGATSGSTLKTIFKSSDPDVGVQPDGGSTLEGSHLYGAILERLSNLDLEPAINHYLYYPNGDTTLPASAKLSAKNIGVPFLLEYNKDNKAADGTAAPVVSEWIGYKPLKNELYAYAWYTKNNVRDYLNDPGYYEKQLGRPVNPDVDDTEGNGAVSATLALPGLFTFYDGIAANRAASDPWASEPGARPAVDSVPDPSGGCGESDKVIELNTENPILGQNGNAGYDVQSYDIKAAYKEGLDAVPASLRSNLHATTTITAKATAALSEVAFDFRVIDLGSGKTNVSKVAVNGTDVTSSVTYLNDATTDTHKLTVKPEAAVASGSEFTVEVTYWVPTGTYRFGDSSTQCFVPSVNSTGATALGEPNGSTFWFPANNNTTDRASYTISLTAPENLTGVSVGTLSSRTAHGTDVTRVWEQTDPTIPYLVTASFGNYLEFAQTITLLDGSTIPSWSYVDRTLYNASNLNQRKAYWFAKDLQSYINWAEGHFGKYPGKTAGFVFEQLADAENSVGYSLETVGRPYYSGIPSTSTFVHEQLHQWFGDSVTIGSWEDLWLNEGFASFLSNIWFEDHDNSAETTNDWYAQWFRENNDSDYWQIAPAQPLNAVNLFGDVTYGRGSYALAALRAGVGDDQFFQIIKTWASQRAGTSATTADFVSTVKAVSTKDPVQLDALLQNYLYEQYKPRSFPTTQLPEADPTAVTVTFDSAGGNAVPSATVPVGTAIGTLPTPSREGYTFGGWFAGGSKIDESFVVPATAVTLVAHWTAVPVVKDERASLNSSAGRAVIAKITDKVATGKQIRPVVTVTFKAKTLKAGTDYTVSYRSNTSVGRATVTVTGKGLYKDSVTGSFTIVPKKVSIRSVKAGKKRISVTWKKLANTTRYQVRYRVAGSGTWKTAAVAGKSTKASLTRLKAGKRYQVQVRAYQTVTKVKYFGAWSATDSAKVKKK